MRSRCAYFAWAALLSLHLIGGAAAQGFSAPIRIVVPQAPGGGTDTVARLLAPGLSKELGQNVVIENRPGASGQIGARAVQGAKPDGTTLLFTTDHPLVIAPLTMPDARVDVLKDFAPLGLVVRTHWVLSVPMDVQYAAFDDYLQALRRESLLRAYGVPLAGGAAKMIGDAIGKHIGVDLEQVPFPGSAPVLQNVMANQIPAGITGMPEAVNAHRAGRARVIAVAGPQRSALMPEVPTFQELGIAGLEFQTVLGYFAPKGLPQSLAQAFNAALRKALADAQIQERILQLGLSPASTTLGEASREIAEMARFWREALGAAPAQQ